jgi:hypothetical protein
MLTVSFGGDVVAEVADGELGVAEEGGVVGSDEGAGDVEDVVIAGLSDGLSQFLGLGFLSVRERFLHGRFSDVKGGFFSKTLRHRLVYKNSTNCRDAHTRVVLAPESSCVRSPTGYTQPQPAARVSSWKRWQTRPNRSAGFLPGSFSASLHVSRLQNWGVRHLRSNILHDILSQGLTEPEERADSRKITLYARRD